MPPAPRRSVSRAHRVRDAVSLGLILLGATGYVIASRGMAELIRHRPYAHIKGSGGGWNLAVWGRYWHLSRASLVVAGLGIAVGVWSFVSSQRTPTSPDAEDHGP